MSLFITLIFWLVGSIILLWSASIEALKIRKLAVLAAFFLSAVIMDIIAALIFYESWYPSIWGIIRFLWLIPFGAFLIIWIKLIKHKI